jgi:hypothetical protein
VQHLQNRLQQHLATHVILHHGEKRGRIEIEYYGQTIFIDCWRCSECKRGELSEAALFVGRDRTFECHHFSSIGCRRKAEEPAAPGATAPAGEAAKPDAPQPGDHRDTCFACRRCGANRKPISGQHGQAAGGTLEEFSGDRAFAEVRRQIEVGPRPAGTPALEKARVLITTELEKVGWGGRTSGIHGPNAARSGSFCEPHRPVCRGWFTAGQRQNAAGDRCSHYDTKKFSTITFVGASDAASSTERWLKLARVLARDPKLAAKIELVFSTEKKRWSSSHRQTVCMAAGCTREI